MPTNKHAIIRYRTIDRCLRDRNGIWNWKSLSDACIQEIYGATGITVKLSERTIKGDLADMRRNDILGYYAPIEYDRKEKSYYYSDPAYAISEIPINKEDKSQLTQALEILKQFGGFSEALGVQSIVTKLQHTINNRSSVTRSVIKFDHPLDAPGQEWTYEIYKKIIDRQVLSIDYRPFGRDRATHTLSPYLLKEYQKRWYLIGYSHQKDQVRTFALDRIADIRESFSDFYLKEDFHADQYFDDVIGLTVDSGSQKERVLFKALGLQIHYFKTRPIHPSQTLIKEYDDHAIFSVTLIINYELISELFSYRKGIEVIEPLHLRRQIKEEIKNMDLLYN